MTLKLAIVLLVTLTLFGAFWTSIDGFAAARTASLPAASCE